MIPQFVQIVQECAVGNNPEMAALGRRGRDVAAGCATAAGVRETAKTRRDRAA